VRVIVRRPDRLVAEGCAGFEGCPGLLTDRAGCLSLGDGKPRVVLPRPADESHTGPVFTGPRDRRAAAETRDHRPPSRWRSPSLWIPGRRRSRGRNLPMASPAHLSLGRDACVDEPFGPWWRPRLRRRVAPGVARVGILRPIVPPALRQFSRAAPWQNCRDPWPRVIGGREVRPRAGPKTSLKVEASAARRAAFFRAGPHLVQEPSRTNLRPQRLDGKSVALPLYGR
jgi:hypothetical protein